MQATRLQAFIITVIFFCSGYSGIVNIFFDQLKNVIVIVAFVILCISLMCNPVFRNSILKLQWDCVFFLVMAMSYLVVGDYLTFFALLIGTFCVVIMRVKPLVGSFAYEYIFNFGAILIILTIFQYLILLIAPGLTPADKTAIDSATGSSKINLTPIEYLGFLFDYTETFGYSYRRSGFFMVEPSATGYVVLPLLYMSLFLYKKKYIIPILFFIFISSQSVLISVTAILCIFGSTVSRMLGKNIAYLILVLLALFTSYILFFIDADVLYSIFERLYDLFGEMFTIFHRKYDSFYERLDDFRGLFDKNSDLQNADGISGIAQSLNNRIGSLGIIIGLMYFIYFSLVRNVNPDKIYYRYLEPSGFVFILLYTIFFINGYGWQTIPGFISIAIITSPLKKHVGI